MQNKKNVSLNIESTSLDLHLGESLEDVLSRIADFSFERIEDPEMGRDSLVFLGCGVELIFKANQLASIFLYLTDHDNKAQIFEGSTDLLSREVLSSDESGFTHKLEQVGFKLSQKKYPFATDLLNSELRIRLSQNKGRRQVLIDDGARLRKSKSG